MRKSIARFLKSQIDYQLADMKSVEISYKWSPKDKSFFIDSEAGLIKFRPRSVREMADFRDKCINKLLALKGNRKGLFKLYKDIRKKYRVRYKANLRTRIRSVF